MPNIRKYDVGYKAVGDYAESLEVIEYVSKREVLVRFTEYRI